MRLASRTSNTDTQHIITVVSPTAIAFSQLVLLIIGGEGEC